MKDIQKDTANAPATPAPGKLPRKNKSRLPRKEKKALQRRAALTK
jgi:hypothetical protein